MNFSDDQELQTKLGQASLMMTQVVFHASKYGLDHELVRRVIRLDELWNDVKSILLDGIAGIQPQAPDTQDFSEDVPD